MDHDVAAGREPSVFSSLPINATWIGDMKGEMVPAAGVAVVDAKEALRRSAIILASLRAGRVVAAPGCECRIFMQPADPFAIEHLSNVASGWFSADCSMPSCPAKCSTAVTGTCQAQPNTKLGGRCLTP